MLIQVIDSKKKFLLGFSMMLIMTIIIMIIIIYNEQYDCL